MMVQWKKLDYLTYKNGMNEFLITSKDRVYLILKKKKLFVLLLRCSSRILISFFNYVFGGDEGE